MKRFACLPLLVLAACPPPGAGPQQPAAPTTGAGCPAASNVFIASYLTHDDPGQAQPAGPPAGSPSSSGGGHTGWVLPLHALKVDSSANQPEFSEIDATTAGALGVPVAPPSAWLMTPGQPPCKATVGSYYAAAVDSSVPSVTYGVELTGCAAPPKDQQQDAEAIALVTPGVEQPPSDCQLLAPQPVAPRLGETDAAKHWQRPTKDTPIPPAFAGVVPAHDCRAPGCEMLWAIAEVDVGNRPVGWTGAVNWLTIPPNATPASQCEWKAETFAGFFVAGPDGRAVKVTDGQDHPLLLGTVLADRSGPRALVAEGAGEYTTYELASGAATVAHHVVWLRLPADAYALDERIGPSCGGEEPPASPPAGPLAPAVPQPSPRR